VSDEPEPREVPEWVDFAAVELVRFTERLDELEADIERRHPAGMSFGPWFKVLSCLILLRKAVAEVQDAVSGAPPIAAMRYTCPRCGVGVGEYCVNVSGQWAGERHDGLYFAHKARWALVTPDDEPADDSTRPDERDDG
jgi:hypothetical protein